MRIQFLVAGFVLCLSLPALAQQTPAVEVSGGYSFVRDQEVEENFQGWLASVAGNFNQWFGIAGEVGGNYKTVQVLGTDVDLSLHSFLAGPRFSARQTQNVTPFGQILLGAVRGSGSVLGEGETATDFALQPGGGVDFRLRPRFGIRVGAGMW